MHDKGKMIWGKTESPEAELRAAEGYSQALNLKGFAYLDFQMSLDG